ncbi:hypothetical protein KBI51_09670 [Aerococcaceae bacterium zg-ZUI334]|uniref:hypothetical protein n=1 Tax=Aerococcaceae bacterium zg-252 TaxID=2796928 RepID=UPI001B92A01E|nr:hypothetical protein [Aerococcaceae bacterium zg-ZUI334]
MKILVEKYLTYGKYSGAELKDSYVVEDTPEERRKILDSTDYDGSFELEDDFINGKCDVFEYESYGGDWDEPTGGFVVVSSYESKLKKLQKDYEVIIQNLNKLFGVS